MGRLADRKLLIRRNRVAPNPVPEDTTAAEARVALRQERLWRQYALNVDLYKFYLDIVLKGMTFFYAITGGILSFYLARPGNGRLKYALFLPLALSIALCVLFLFGRSRLGLTWEEVQSFLHRLEDIDTVVDMRILRWTLLGAAIILALTAVGIVLAIVFL